MRYRRTPIEVESPEELGYDAIANNLAESSFRDRTLADYGIDTDVGDLLLPYGDHRGVPRLREQLAGDAPGAVSVDDVIVTAGAASALFIVASALLEAGDHDPDRGAQLRHQPGDAADARRRGRGDPAALRGRLGP